MKIIEFSYLDEIKIPEKINLCLGYFDSLHIGHISMIKEALKNNTKTALMTFDVSPNYVLGKKDKLEGISSLSDKADYLNELGLDYLFILHFDKELSEVSHEDFVSNILNKFNIDTIYCGEDYRFGYCALGDVSYLKDRFKVHVYPVVTFDNKKISTRDIVNLVKNGDITNANKLLGRNYRLCGTVCRGLGNGHKIGFATANLDLDYNYVLPKEAVYMGYCFVDDVKYKAVISISEHPTIERLNKAIIEVHLIDFDDNLYGKFLYVELVSFIRDIVKFKSLDELTEQIQKDVIKAKKELKL
jgi:riboflavin kinase/FMN adenylyltransferase